MTVTPTRNPMENHVTESLPNIASQLADCILQVLGEVDKGFHKVMWMYLSLFYLGLALIALACVASLVTNADKISLVFGGIGLVDVIGFLAFKPVEDLQKSRGNLAQLVSAFLTWYNDTHNWNQVSLKLLRDQGEINIRAFKAISDSQIANTMTLLSAIDLFIASKGSHSQDQLAKVVNELKSRTAAQQEGPREAYADSKTAGLS